MGLRTEMTQVAGVILYVAMVIGWLAGLVLAKGFWSTVAAIFLPPWAWYLVVERWMQMSGWAF